METPNKFWIHVIGPGIQALDDLVSEMTEYYNKAENRELHSKTVKTLLERLERLYRNIKE